MLLAGGGVMTQRSRAFLGPTSLFLFLFLFLLGGLASTALAASSPRTSTASCPILDALDERRRRNR